MTTRIPEYASKIIDGVKHVRYCGKWALYVIGWAGNHAECEDANGRYVFLACSDTGYVRLPSGRRTRQIYH